MVYSGSLQTSAQMHNIQKNFTKCQISLPNTKYCLLNTKYNVLLKRNILTGEEQHFIYCFTLMGYILSEGLIRVFSGWSGDEKRLFTGYDMLTCTDNLLERESNIIFGWRNIMFGRRNLHSFIHIILFIPSTFHVPLRPTTSPIHY